MHEYATEKYDYAVAFSQFLRLYHQLTREALVYILPSEGNFQDQTFVANLGCYLPHITNENIIVISNYQSLPRIGEEKVGIPFFHSMGYKIIQPPTTFEGEADLKFIRDNIYVGGHGLRTQLETHYWLMDATDAEIITIEMDEAKLYHFDCILLPLTQERALVATEVIKRADLRKLEKVVEIVSIPSKYIYDAWTNSVIVNGEIFNCIMDVESKNYFFDYISRYGLTPIDVDVSEFDKSGAGLSCMVMHLNYRG
jgi:N-dimethylarginine dimethylaminohydrolase